MAWRQILGRAAIYSAGCVISFLAVCLWLKIAGFFPSFSLWTFTYIREYATAISFGNGVGNAGRTLERIFQSASLLYLLAGMGLGCLLPRRVESNKRIFLASLITFSAQAESPYIYFRKHYVIVLAPAVALLAAVGVTSVSHGLARKFQWPWLVHLGFLLGIFACLQSLFADRLVLFSLTPREACRAVYGINPFPESIEIARYIEENSSKDQRVFVLGDEPEIYFYSHRLSANSQIYPSQTMDPRPYAHKMQERMISEIEQKTRRNFWFMFPFTIHCYKDPILTLGSQPGRNVMREITCGWQASSNLPDPIQLNRVGELLQKPPLDYLNILYWSTKGWSRNISIKRKTVRWYYHWLMTNRMAEVLDGIKHFDL